MLDIVKRLEELALRPDIYGTQGQLAINAARSEIERLRKASSDTARLLARIAHLKKALVPFSGLAFQYDSRIFPPETDETARLATTLGDCRRAQEALGAHASAGEGVTPSRSPTT